VSATTTSGRRDPAVAARVLLAAVAVLLVAWFVLMARNWHVGEAASRQILQDPGMSAAEWAHTMREFDSAETLDPSTDWSLHKANYMLLRDKPEAARVALDVTRREPDNLRAWVTVRTAAEGRDPRLARAAAAEIERLNPAPPGR
jgi:hypothetical protein